VGRNRGEFKLSYIALKPRLSVPLSATRHFLPKSGNSMDIISTYQINDGVNFAFVQFQREKHGIQVKLVVGTPPATILHRHSFTDPPTSHLTSSAAFLSYSPRHTSKTSRSVRVPWMHMSWCMIGSGYFDVMCCAAVVPADATRLDVSLDVNVDDRCCMRCYVRMLNT
jgi:hypothetical protein